MLDDVFELLNVISILPVTSPAVAELNASKALTDIDLILLYSNA